MDKIKIITKKRKLNYSKIKPMKKPKVKKVKFREDVGKQRPAKKESY